MKSNSSKKFSKLLFFFGRKRKTLLFSLKTLFFLFLFLLFFNEGRKRIFFDLHYQFFSFLHQNFASSVKMEKLDFLQKYIGSLEKQSQKLDFLQKEYENLSAENTSLRKLIKIKKSSRKLIFAEKIQSFSPLKQDVIFINKGYKNSVKLGMFALSNKGLVGKVISVSQNFAEILLLSSPNFQISAKVGNTRVSGTVRGNNSAFLQFFNLPKNLKNIKNTKVYSMEGKFLIGKIHSVQENFLASEAKIISAINLDKIKIIFLISE